MCNRAFLLLSQRNGQKCERKIKMADIKITNEELKSKNNSVIPKTTKEFANANFWYYTSQKTVNDILESKQFHVSSLCRMNDREEAQLHTGESEDVFALCFCNSNSEKIPMWYLYSGVAGRGMAIGFTCKTMMNFIDSISVAYDVETGDKLEKGKEFELRFGWVFYRRSSTKSEIFYRNKWYKIEDENKFEEDNYFIKSYPWEYEREFRLVFINKSGCKHDRLRVDIPDALVKKLKFRTAPEMTEDTFLESYPGLKGFARISWNAMEHSKLGISMNLLERNQRSIKEFVFANLGKIVGKLDETEQKEIKKEVDEALLAGSK